MLTAKSISEASVKAEGIFELFDGLSGAFRAQLFEIEFFLSIEPTLVSGKLPTGDVMGREAGMAECREAFDDRGIGFAVDQHEVDGLSDGIGQATDFASGGARTSKGWMVGYGIHAVDMVKCLGERPGDRARRAEFGVI